MTKKLSTVQLPAHRISPVNQAGSWQLEHYLIVVGKSTGSGHPVQILTMPRLTLFSHEMHFDIDACEAARAALRKHFGSDSDEYKEFLDHYGYDCKDTGPHPKNERVGRGTKITDLDGVSTKHTLEHALRGCGCSMRDVINCVICERRLDPDRQHVDTCGEKCFNKLLRIQLPAWTR